MSTLNITPTYATSSVLYEADLDASIKTPIESHFNNAEVEGSNIQSESITGSLKIQNSAITSDKIANNAVTSAKLEDAISATTGILTTKILNDAVTTDKILNANITTEKLANSAVTAAKIGTWEIPKTIMLDLPRASADLSNLTINWARTTTSGPDGTAGPSLVGSVSISGLTSGKPVIISLESSSAEYDKGYIEAIATLNVSSSSGFETVAGGIVHIYKDGSKIASHQITSCGAYGTNPTAYIRIPLSAITHIDVASNSSHTYSIYLESVAFSSISTDFIHTNQCSMTINSAQLKVLQVV